MKSGLNEPVGLAASLAQITKNLSGASVAAGQRGDTNERDRSSTSSTTGVPAPVEPVHPAQNLLPAESGHWYLPNGEPYYTVIAKTTGKPRPVTIKDARLVGAVPSVTTILKVTASEGLERYKLRQLFDAACGLEPIKGESRDNYFGRCLDASKEHSRAAAERGTALHAELERFLRGELTVNHEWLPHVANVCSATCQYGLNIKEGESEKSFAHDLGFGGKVDFHSTSKNSIFGGVVIDFKTKPSLDMGNKRYAYSNHAIQLAAYRVGLGIPEARCINVFIGCEDRKVLIHEWNEEDLSKAWRQFQLLLEYWQLEKGYAPKT
jgi:hypothetical protein